MRVLHLVHQYLPEHVGGTELYTRWLTQAQTRQGHTVAIFHRRSATGSGLAERNDGDVRVWSAWAGEFTPLTRLLATFRQTQLVDSFNRVLDAFTPELVHVQHLMGLPAACADILRQRNIPYGITLWDFWWVCANAQLYTNYAEQICPGPQAYLNCARCALARAGKNAWIPIIPALSLPLAWRNQRLRRVMLQANRLIAPMPFVADWYAGYGAPAERLITLPPGLEDAAPLPRPPHQHAEPIRFGYVGGISPQKGVHVLVEAFAGLRGLARLAVAGDVTTHPQYTAQLKRAATEAVQFVGRLDRAAVWQLLAQMDVLVVPSVWYETFAFVISEAFAAGVPVIVSKLGPLADRVQHNVDGLLFAPGDVTALQQAMQRFLTEPDLLPRLQAGIKPPITIANHAAQVETLYQSILAEHNRL